MITGFDSVFVLGGNVPELIFRFLDTRLREWPGMMVSVADVDADNGRFERWADHKFTLPPAAEILVVRDEVMESAWSEDGYSVSSEGEGQFAIHYEGMKRAATRMTALDDPYARQGFGFEPYEVTVVGGTLSLVTLVTPDSESEFSVALTSSFVASLGA